MLWSIILFLCGSLTGYVVEKKFCIELVSLQGILIVVCVFVVIEIIKHIVTRF